VTSAARPIKSTSWETVSFPARTLLRGVSRNTILMLSPWCGTFLCAEQLSVGAEFSTSLPSVDVSIANSTLQERYPSSKPSHYGDNQKADNAHPWKYGGLLFAVLEDRKMCWLYAEGMGGMVWHIVWKHLL
jgi:hypothetical protein